MVFSNEELIELKNILCWAISEGYGTNEVTKTVAHRLKIEPTVLMGLDKCCNIGVSLSSQQDPTAHYRKPSYEGYLPLKGGPP